MKKLLLIFSVITWCMCTVSLAQHQRTVVKKTAQTATVQGDWTRRVSRVVEVPVIADTVKMKYRQEDVLPPLSEILTNALLNGSLIAYTSDDTRLLGRFTAADFRRVFLPIDTMVMEDPVTGLTVAKIIKRDIDYSEINKYRILEEWSFNKATGRGTAQVVAIAPITKVYDENGNYLGDKSMYWIKYADALPYLKKYEAAHAQNNLLTRIWMGYFDE